MTNCPLKILTLPLLGRPTLELREKYPDSADTVRLGMRLDSVSNGLLSGEMFFRFQDAWTVVNKHISQIYNTYM